MPTNYEYDEASETWPSFILTGILMVVGPMTLLQIYQIFFGANAEDGNSGKSKEFNEEVFKNLMKNTPVMKSNNLEGSLIKIVIRSPKYGAGERL